MKLSVRDCGRYDLAIWRWDGRINSVSYRLPGGRITFYDAGTRPGSEDDVALFTIDREHPEIADLGDFTRLADYLIREC